MIWLSHLYNVLSCLMQEYNFKSQNVMFKCAFSYRKVISKTTPQISQACGRRHWECTATNVERAQFPGVSPLVLQGGGPKMTKFQRLLNFDHSLTKSLTKDMKKEVLLQRTRP